MLGVQILLEGSFCLGKDKGQPREGSTGVLHANSIFTNTVVPFPRLAGLVHLQNLVEGRDG